MVMAELSQAEGVAVWVWALFTEVGHVLMPPQPVK